MRAISEKTATVMNRLLRNVVVSGTGRLANIKNWEVIGKTGSTNSNKDSWFVGETPWAVAGIWTGYNLPKRLSSTAYSKQVWKAIMEKYLEGKEQKDYVLDNSAFESEQTEEMSENDVGNNEPNVNTVTSENNIYE